MEQILEENQIIGKTIKSIGYGENAFCIVFTDNTFGIVKGTGYGDWDVEYSNDTINLEPDEFNAHNLEKMGLITRLEASQAIRASRKKQRERREQSERDTYERLKRKFDSQ